MTHVTLYHNPSCSKSRQTLQHLKERSIDLEIIEYLKTPPSIRQLKSMLELLNLEPRQLMRTQEAAYKALNLDNPEKREEELIRAMHLYPVLIERPIVIANHRAVIARPPEKMFDIL